MTTPDLKAKILERLRIAGGTMAHDIWSDIEFAKVLFELRDEGKIFISQERRTLFATLKEQAR
jgi:hypothetical protein